MNLEERLTRRLNAILRHGGFSHARAVALGLAPSLATARRDLARLRARFDFPELRVSLYRRAVDDDLERRAIDPPPEIVASSRALGFDPIRLPPEMMATYARLWRLKNYGN